MSTRTDIVFDSLGTALRGWFYTPSNAQKKSPCIVMTHGFSALKEHDLDKFARVFADAGMCVVAYDNRNFGESDGAMRQEVDPQLQIEDYRCAISYVQSRDEVDAEKIGIWGTSFSGGHVLVVSAIDKRVKCAVAQVPFISGHHPFLQSNKPEKWQQIKTAYDADRAQRERGEPPAMIQVAAQASDSSAIIRTPDAYEFFSTIPAWQNQVTLRSVENSGDYQPITYIKQISPTPLLFIVADHDTVNATQLALDAYQQALEPKKLVLFPGEHFDPYNKQFTTCATAACEWFKTFLINEEKLK